MSSISSLPERHDAVKDILAELHRCINVYSETVGPGIKALFPRLQKEFWMAASLIYSTAPRPTAVPVPSSAPSSSSAALPPPSTPTPRDVRNWPAWIRGRMSTSELDTILYAVFTPIVAACKAKPRMPQRLNKVAVLYQTKDHFMILDFGSDICGSEYAMQNLASFKEHNRTVPLSVVVDALWDQVLSRPSLSPVEPPTPEVGELTRALKKLDPLWNRKGASSTAGSRSVSAEPSAAASASPPRMSTRARGKRPATDLDPSVGDEDDDEDDDPELPRARLTKRPRRSSNDKDENDNRRGSFSPLNTIVELDEVPSHYTPALTTPAVAAISPAAAAAAAGRLSPDARPSSSSPALFFSPQEGRQVDKDALRFEHIRGFLSLGDPMNDDHESPEVRVALTTLYGAAMMALRSLP